MKQFGNKAKTQAKVFFVLSLLILKPVVQASWPGGVPLGGIPGPLVMCMRARVLVLCTHLKGTNLDVLV